MKRHINLKSRKMFYAVFKKRLVPAVNVSSVIIRVRLKLYGISIFCKTIVNITLP